MSSQTEYNEKPLADMSDEEMSYLISYTDRVSGAYTATANTSYSEANATEQSLSGQLMLLNTVILSASLLALGNGDLFSKLTEPHKVMICLIVGLQVLSIVAGIVSYKLRERFFAGAGRNASESAKIAKGRKFKNLNDLERLLRNNDVMHASQSGSLAVDFQIGLITLSLLIFAVLIYSIFFNVPYYNN